MENLERLPYKACEECSILVALDTMICPSCQGIKFSLITEVRHDKPDVR